MRTLQQRFFSYVAPAVTSNGCWEWVGAKDLKGYGTLMIRDPHKRLAKAHRLSWELHEGAIPAKMCVLHKCDNPSCVNPRHLFIGTQRDNQRDKVEKNRQAKGIVHGRVVLTEDQVREIRTIYVHCSAGCPMGPHITVPTSISGLAKRFGVSRPTIAAIIRGETWKALH